MHGQFLIIIDWKGGKKKINPRAETNYIESLFVPKLADPLYCLVCPVQLNKISFIISHLEEIGQPSLVS